MTMRTVQGSLGFARTSGVGLAAALLLLSTGCDQDVNEPPPDGDVKSVDLVFGETTATVDLGDLEVVTIEGEGYARLSDVVEAADLGVALDELEFDFEASDGFRSGARSTCVEHIPAPGAWLRQGYVHRVTRNLAWDEELEMPGCTWVDDLSRLLAAESGSTQTDVVVVYGDRSVSVNLRSLEAVDFEGAEHVLLADLVAWADLGVPLANLAFDFEGSDSYRPSTSANCAEVVPLEGSRLAAGFVSLETFDLVWDEAADLPGCMNVDGLLLIEATELETEGPTVEVSYGGATVTVDLSAAEVVDFAGEDQVRLAEVVELAALGVELEDLLFDFAAGDGYRPSESANCADLFPLAGDQLAGGYIALASRDLSWDEALDLPGCANVDDLALIVAVDAEPSQGPFVEVVYGETTVTVDLSEAQSFTAHGEAAVRVVDLVALAGLSVATEDLLFDFEAADGYRPSARSTCAGVVPVTGTQLQAAYVLLASLNLEWDGEAGMPGCANVDDLTLIEALDP